MRYIPGDDDEEAQAITRLTYGTLAGQERESVEAWAAERPEVVRQVARERRVSEALGTAGPPLPPQLLANIEAKVRGAYGTPAPRRGAPRLSLRWRPAYGLAAAVAAAAAIIIGAGVAVTGGPSGPTIPATANLDHSPATGPSPAPHSATLLDISYGGVTYPNYTAEFGVTPDGQRADRLSGRRMLTVFYRLPGGTRLSYTVISGPPLALPSHVQTVVFDGVPLHYFRTASGLSVVTLVRHGRTCVLAAHASPQFILGLATAPLRNEATT